MSGKHHYTGIFCTSSSVYVYVYVFFLFNSARLGDLAIFSFVGVLLAVAKPDVPCGYDVMYCFLGLALTYITATCRV